MKILSFNFVKHYDLRRSVLQELSCFASCRSKIAISFSLENVSTAMLYFWESFFDRKELLAVSFKGLKSEL